MLNKLYKWYGKRTVVAVIVVLIVIIAVGLSSQAEPNEVVEDASSKNFPAVTVSTPAMEAGSTQISLIGKVRAANEAMIVSESSGKVTSVNAKLGQKVANGQILIQLENQSERAALLQAEGVYEAAVAGSAQADIGVGQAEIQMESALKTAKTASQNSYSTANSVVLNNLDDFFINPTTGIIGIRLSGVGNTEFLNNERKAFRDMLPKWRKSSIALKDVADAYEKLEISTEYTNRVLNMVDIFTFIVNDSRGNKNFTITQENSYKQNLASARTQLVASLTALDNAITSLDSAKESLKSTAISASGSETSLADAQIKQALGALRSTQSNFNKTIIRTPISGTVNALDIKLGQYIGTNEEIASIANNSKIEIITYVSDKERALISVGDEVEIEGGTTGKIILIAPAVDSQTRKIEVRITSDDDSLLIGDTVRLTSSKDVVTLSIEVRIPLTALKFSSADSSIFTVSEDNTLVSVPVTLGEIYGSETVVLSGMDINTEFVVDARGRNTGEEVAVNNKQ
jgi:RND family efflux transporter MFP subunit